MPTWLLVLSILAILVLLVMVYAAYRARRRFAGHGGQQSRAREQGPAPDRIPKDQP